MVVQLSSPGTTQRGGTAYNRPTATLSQTCKVHTACRRLEAPQTDGGMGIGRNAGGAGLKVCRSNLEHARLRRRALDRLGCCLDIIAQQRKKGRDSTE